MRGESVGNRDRTMCGTTGHCSAGETASGHRSGRVAPSSVWARWDLHGDKIGFHMNREIFRPATDNHMGNAPALPFTPDRIDGHAQAFRNGALGHWHRKGHQISQSL